MKNSITERIQRLPVPVLPTMVGAATLSNVFAGMGYEGVRHITMLVSTIVILVYLAKICLYPKVFLQEYGNVVLASLYAGFTMLLMILGSYYFAYSEVLGRTIWYIGVCLHALHIIVFSIRNVLLTRNIDTFVPSWFVTYNGILVACVVGGGIGNQTLLNIIAHYGIIIYAILIPIMVWRLAKHEIKAGMFHTQAIVLAPCSLCTVSYITAVTNPVPAIIYALYACVLLSLLFVISKLPKFFAVSFTPAFAGLTFPMAIGIVASLRMAGYVAITNEKLAFYITQINGVQIYLTTAIVGFVLFNFMRMIPNKK